MKQGKIETGAAATRVDFKSALEPSQHIEIEAASDLIGRIAIIRDQEGANVSMIFSEVKDNESDESILFLSCLNRPMETFNTEKFYSQFDLTPPDGLELYVSRGGGGDQAGRFFVNTKLLNEHGLISDINMGEISVITSPDTLVPALKIPEVASKMRGAIGAYPVPLSTFEHTFRTTPAFLVESDGQDIFNAPARAMWRNLFEGYMKSDAASLITPTFYNPEQELSDLQRLEYQKEGMTAFYPN